MSKFLKVEESGFSTEFPKVCWRQAYCVDKGGSESQDIISAQSQCASWAYKGMTLTRCCILRGKPNYLQLIHFYCSLSFVLLLLISLSERADGENCSEKDVLDVKPLNKSHLLLKDIKSLKDRYQKECISQNMTVRNLSAKAVSHAAVDKVFELNIHRQWGKWACCSRPLLCLHNLGDRN